MAGAAASFEPLRPRLVRVAYRMLGSIADAEDVVQEAFMRWMEANRAEVREPEAFLRRTVTRLCLDHLKSARSRLPFAVLHRDALSICATWKRASRSRPGFSAMLRGSRYRSV
jgi:DNA-directed RNA polymerase specialized sigma24 family protein